MAERRDVQISETTSPGGNTTLRISGTLDSSTYREVRDSVIKAALGEPKAVVVDVTHLEAPAESAWTAFTSARWHVSTWPDIPVVLVCGHAAGRAAIRHCGASRYVPVYPDEATAAQSVGDLKDLRRRASAILGTDPDSLPSARALLVRWLTQWERPEMVLTASTVATIFIENTLEHTASRPTLTLEVIGDRITVAVSDESREPAARHEDSMTGTHTVSGLAIVSALSRAWGCTPTMSGKTVWAMFGPENQL